MAKRHSKDRQSGLPLNGYDGQQSQNKDVPSHINRIGFGQSGYQSARNRQIGADDVQKQQIAFGKSSGYIQDKNGEADNGEAHADEREKWFLGMKQTIQVKIRQPGYDCNE